jgi:hypothetical protein|tara:strand:+ start:172 stop:414 length:243 start_codon:yes stop_codon:yes gene_type:complete
MKTKYTSKMDLTKEIKKEYQPGGSKRQYILDKAVEYIRDVPGLQQSKHWFCVEKLMMTETEYLEALNKATNGALVKDLWN